MQSLRTARRGLVVTLLSVATVTSVSGLTSVADAGSAITATAMARTQFQSAPTLKSTRIAWVPRNTTVKLTCKTSAGQAVRGWAGGPDAWWYGITYKGRHGYIADVDWKTAKNAPKLALSKCASSASTKAARAVAWANSQVGSQNYSGLCELFVERSYGTSGRYASAIVAYRALKGQGKIHTGRSGIPAGALVFASDYTYDRGYGHVELSRGSGKGFVSGGANGPTVKIFTALPRGYLGWAYAPTSWPGR